jgi:hypothetical protein
VFATSPLYSFVVNRLEGLGEDSFPVNESNGDVSTTAPVLLTRFQVQQLVLGILYEESPVGPQPLGNCDNAEDGPDIFGFLSAQNVRHTNLSQLAQCVEVVLLQPVRHSGVLAFSAGRFDDCHDRVGIPVTQARGFDKSSPVASRLRMRRPQRLPGDEVLPTARAKLL